MFPAFPAEDLEKLFPIVRVKTKDGLFGKKAEMVCLTEESVVSGRCRFNRNLANESFTPESIRENWKRVKQIPLDEVTSVVVSPGGRLWKQATVKVVGRKSKVFQVPHDQSEHLIVGLKAKLGDRVQLSRRVRLHGWALNFVILLVVLLAVAMVVMNSGNTNPNDLKFMVIVLACTVLPLLLIPVWAHWPMKWPWEVEPKKQKPGKDRSGREPFRSRFLGWTLKLVAVAWVLVVWFFGLGWLIAVPGLIFLYLGHLLAQVPPRLVAQTDQRAPILYLRSFHDDRHSTLMPYSRTAVYMGIQAPRYMPSPWKYILLMHPVRVLRILFGLGSDTSEEQLAKYFRKHGPFVAIGKPGEKFTSPGATRMYVTNEQWQDVVHEFLDDSQIVLLQPSKTEGIWWEVEKTLSQVDPQKILVCLVNFYQKQNDYEKFRLRAESFLKQPLPRYAAYTRTPTFLYFDKDWNPYLQEVSCHAPANWPFRGETIDLNYTLQPFLNSALEKPEPEVAESSATVAKRTRRSVSAGTFGNLPREPRGISAAARNSGLFCFIFLAMLLGVVPAGVNRARQAAQLDKSLNGLQPNDGESSFEVKNRPSETSQAKVTLRDILEAPEPTDAAGWVERGHTFIELGHRELGMDAWELAVMHESDDVEVYRLLGEYFSQKNEYSRAASIYQQYVKIDDTNSEIWNRLGTAQLLDDQFEEAIASLDQAIKLQPETPVIYANRGLAYFESGKFAQAIEDFRQSLELDSQQPYVLFHAGRALAKQGKWVEAIRHFNTVLQLDPEFTKVYAERYVAFVRLGDQKDKEFNPYQFALRDLDELIKRLPDDLTVRRERIAVLYLDQQNQQAITEATQYLEDDPDNVDVLKYRATAYSRTREFESALADWESIVKLEPNNFDAQFERVTALENLNRLDDAIEQINLVVAAHPTAVNPMVILARLQSKIGEHESSLQSYLAALEMQPESPGLLELAGIAYANLGQFDAANDAFVRGVRSSPKDPDWYLYLVLVQGLRGNWDAVDDHFQKMEENIPSGTNLSTQIGGLRFQTISPDRPPAQWAEKLEWFEEHRRQGRISIESAQGRFLLGALQTGAGKWEDAIKTLSSLPEEDVLLTVGSLLWLSMAQSQLGEQDLAEGNLTKAQSWIDKNCSLVVAEGQPMPQEMGWVRRAELHLLLRKAEAILKQNQVKEQSEKPADDRVSILEFLKYKNHSHRKVRLPLIQSAMNCGDYQPAADFFDFRNEELVAASPSASSLTRNSVLVQ